MGPNTGSPPPGVCPEGIFACGDSPASRTAQSSSGSARRHPDTCAHRRMAAQAVRRAALPARIALRGSRAALRVAARVALRIAVRLAAWNLSMCRPPSFAAVYAPRRFFMRAGGLPCGGVPLASPGLNPGGTYSPNKKGTRRGGVLFFSPPYPAFSFLYCPPSQKGKDRPPPALAERSSPPGKGETKSLFRRGLRPRHPGIRPPAALVRPAAVVLNGGACPCAALAIPAPGERTISNAAVACDG